MMPESQRLNRLRGGMLKLFYAAHTCSLATHIVLEEVGADYSTARIDFAKDEQRSPEYLKVNPKGRVPALVTDRGILTETPAMLVFVAQSFPAAGPRADRRSVRLRRGAGLQQLSLLDTCTSRTRIACAAIAGSMPTMPHSIAAMQRKVPESVGACFELIERDMLKGPWVMGERYTICDPYLFTLAQWLGSRRRRCRRAFRK